MAEITRTIDLSPQIEGMLGEARSRLERCRGILQGMRISPSFLEVAERFAELQGRQTLLEQAFSQLRNVETPDSRLGFIPAFIIAAGTALLASTAGSLIYFSRVKKHLEETRAYERYLECLDNASRAGMSPSQAKSYCLGPYSKEGDWLRLVLLGAGIVGGMMLLGKLIRWD